MDYQTQIDNLIELAIVQRDELKQLVEQLPQLRDYLSAEVEKKFEAVEPELRSELEAFFAQKTDERVEDLRGEVSERIAEVLKSLEMAASAKYAALMQEKDRAAEVLNQAEAKIAEVQAAIPGKVKELVTDELSRFPRANQIDQLRKEFAEPRGLNPRGKWQASERYQKLDLVSYNGESYVSNVDDNAEKPSRSSAAWTLSAARGQGGGGGGITSLNDLIGPPSSDLDIVGAEGSNYVRKTLTAGTNVTLTETPTEITISSTGGGGGTSAETLIANVTNAESFAITKGQVVYAFAATGNRVSVKLAYNTSDATSAKTFGVVSSASISAGGTGTVTCVGVIDGLNLGTFAEGDSVYLGATPGTFTATKPYAPNHLVYVGIVERANAGNGELYVRIQNGYELDEIHDVQITAPKLAGQTLLYDATTDLWKNARLTGTANQITVTNADAAVTLSIPTNPTLPGNVTVAGGTVTGGGGPLTLAASGSNQSVTLTPTGAATAGSLAVSRLTSTNQTLALLNYGTDELMSIVGTGYTGIGSRSNTGFLLYSNNTERARFMPGGNLLIGKTIDNTLGRLQVNGAITMEEAAGTGLFGFFGGSTLVYGSLASNPVVIRTNNTAALTLDTSQNATFAGNINALAGKSLNFTGTPAALTSFVNMYVTSLAGGDATGGRMTWYSTGTGNVETGFLQVTQPDGFGGTFSIGLNTTNSGTASTVFQIKKNGSTLLGTTFDSSNGRLQLATHTASTGGIGFGTDVVLYRQTADVLKTDDCFVVSGTGLPNTTHGLELQHNGTTGYVFSYNRGTNTPLAIAINHTGGNVELAASGSHQVIVKGTGVSNSTSSGALVISGGVGIAGNTYIGGNLVVSGTITPSSGAGLTNVWIPASQWIPRTTNGCGVDSTETTTNRQNFDELLFDPAAIEYAQALVRMPSNYNNGTVTARFFWSSSSSTGSVVWGLQARAFADDDALDTAFGTAQTVTDTLLATGDMHISAATSAVTSGGTPAATTPLQFQIYRDATNGSDTLGSDARLLGVEISFTSV